MPERERALVPTRPKINVAEDIANIANDFASDNGLKQEEREILIKFAHLNLWILRLDRAFLNTGVKYATFEHLDSSPENRKTIRITRDKYPALKEELSTRALDMFQDHFMPNPNARNAANELMIRLRNFMHN